MAPKKRPAAKAAASPDAKRRYVVSTDFPPPDCREGEQMMAWYRNGFCAIPMKKGDPTLTQRQKKLLRMSAQEYVAERKKGDVTCEEYTSLLVKRALYYRYMNQWTFRSYDLFWKAVQRAKALDKKADAQGVDSIAPLYGLPIPMKGTAAVVDFPSGAGVGVLSSYTPVKNSELTDMILERNGIILGTSNVPEFAASVNTANKASGQCRNPYNHSFCPGGSSGGAGSAVAMFMSPVAVSEDTGGSTRVPALFNGLFGFDPARNHYPNQGNCGMSVTRDQIGVVCRSFQDVLFYDEALMQERHQAQQLHESARELSAARQLSSIRIACPETPFVRGKFRQLDETMRAPYEAAKAALLGAGLQLSAVDWPSAPQSADKEWQKGGVKPITSLFPDGQIRWPFRAFSGLVAQWVHEYLDAPVSIKEIAEDTARLGETNPGVFYRPDASDGLMKASEMGDETNYRYAVGPLVKELVERYNSLFEVHKLDFILVPAAYNATPDLDQALGGCIPALDADGKPAQSNIWQCVYPNNDIMKDIHIPKLSVPTGLADGRPTGVQLWGRAVPYQQMFEDKHSTRHSINFLHLVSRVVDAIHADPKLRPVPPPIAQDLWK